MTMKTISQRDSMTISRSIADVDAVLSLLRRQADSLRIQSALIVATRTINTCRQRVFGAVAQADTAWAHAELSSLGAGGDIDASLLARTLQRLRDTVQQLRRDGGSGLVGG